MIRINPHHNQQVFINRAVNMFKHTLKGLDNNKIYEYIPIEVDTEKHSIGQRGWYEKMTRQISEGCGIDDHEKTKEIIKERYGIEETRDMSSRQMSSLIQRIEADYNDYIDFEGYDSF